MFSLLGGRLNFGAAQSIFRNSTEVRAGLNSETIDSLFERYGPAYRWLATVTCMVGAMTVVLSMTTAQLLVVLQMEGRQQRCSL